MADLPKVVLDKLEGIDFEIPPRWSARQGDQFKQDWVREEMEGLFAVWKLENKNANVPDPAALKTKLFMERRYPFPILPLRVVSDEAPDEGSGSNKG